MNTLTWLHLSDLHFRASQAHNSNVVLKALLRDIRERIQKDGLHPDFLAVTGDIAFSGQPAEYALARAFLDDLLAATDLPRERLFLVPGNHDVNRSLVTLGVKAIGAALTDRESANTLLTTLEDRQRVMARFKG
jgi:predicted MPP superfamily phosphohydrolase